MKIIVNTSKYVNLNFTLIDSLGCHPLLNRQLWAILKPRPLNLSIITRDKSVGSIQREQEWILPTSCPRYAQIRVRFKNLFK